MGWLLKKQTDQLSCSMIGWGGGVNLWYQLTPGTKLFVEPRFMHNEYNIPYTNVDRVKRYSDNYLTLNVGVAVEVRDDARYYSHSYYQEYVEDRLRQIKVGLGGGLHLLQTENAMAEGGGLGLNATLFGEYHFDRLKSVRLGVDFINMKDEKNYERLREVIEEACADDPCRMQLVDFTQLGLAEFTRKKTSRPVVDQLFLLD
jgi:hypothetical protein